MQNQSNSNFLESFHKSLVGGKQNTNKGGNTDGKWNFSLYPNPAHDKITLEFFKPISHEFSFSLCNINGKESNDGKLYFSHSNISEIPVINLPSGIYLLEIKDKGAPSYRRLLILQ